MPRGRKRRTVRKPSVHDRLAQLNLAVVHALKLGQLQQHRDPPFWYGVWIPFQQIQALERALHGEQE